MNYYESEAHTFFADTVDINVTGLLTPFTDLLPDGARVLDAGCGSGRDTLFFRQQGFRVDAFDASFALCGLASEYSGIQVTRQRIQEFEYQHMFNGIWCNAVLLHVPPNEMNAVMERLRNQLRVGGVLFVSFRRGDFEERKVGERTFTYMDKTHLRPLIDEAGMALDRLWITNDNRPDNDTEWVNAIARRVG